MPVSFQPSSPTQERPPSLRSETLSTPLLSPTPLKEIPFKPQDDDHVSLSMKKGRNHRHERSGSTPRRQAPGRPETRRQTTQVPGARYKPRNLRKTNSLPTVQPRFDHGSVETLEAHESLPVRARRWTVSSKAASTCRLATLVPVDETVNKAEPASSATLHADQSPAMTTLRRATTVRSRRQTTTLTSFPPPKFSRSSNGLLSSFLSSIAGYAESPSHVLREDDARTSSMREQRKPSTSSIRSSLHTSTGAVAPTVQTEVSAVESRRSVSGPNQAGNSMRRCSTRYITENGVYEIIWDENWPSSSGSEGGDRSPHGRGSILQSRELAGVDSLERRLSNALSRSRRASVQVNHSGSRKTSYVPGTETSLQSIWANPKIARLFREPASERVPRSKSSKKASKTIEVMPPLLANEDLDHDIDGEGSKQRASPNHVEFFPPLRSRANTNGNKSPGHVSPEVVQDTPSKPERPEPAVTSLVQDDSRPRSPSSRFGSMLGISSHERRSISDQHGQRRRRVKVGGRRASDGERRAKASDDETVPLLGGT